MQEQTQASLGACSVGLDVIPGETDDAVAGQLEVRVRGRVSLPIAARSVVCEAVQLHDQPVAGPASVDLVLRGLAVNEHVEARDRKGGSNEELVEEVLELASSVVRSPCGDRVAEGAGAAPSSRARKKLLDGSEVEPLEPLRAVERSCELRR